MQNLASLHTLLLHELHDLYDAEYQIADVLPKMRDAAHAEDLKKAFDDHLNQTEEQTRRLEEAFAALGEPPMREHCPGISGILQEGKEMMEEQDATPDAFDTALIASARRVEHYEMAGYSSAWRLAQTLQYHQVADLLNETRKEENITDKKLAKLATKTAHLAKGDIASRVSS